jgi:uncharacterized membrane protein YgdD (TMEM256/DUF423 family)
MWWRVAGVFGALGVGLGSFGAHGLKAIVTDPSLMANWQTAAHYHLIHTLALLAVAAHPGRPRKAGIAFSIGIVVFSGSLYLMALTGMRWLGAITPIGGLAFITGWLLLAFAPLDPEQ